MSTGETAARLWTDYYALQAQLSEAAQENTRLRNAVEEYKAWAEFLCQWVERHHGSEEAEQAWEEFMGGTS